MYYNCHIPHPTLDLFGDCCFKLTRDLVMACTYLIERKDHAPLPPISAFELAIHI